MQSNNTILKIRLIRYSNNPTRKQFYRIIIISMHIYIFIIMYNHKNYHYLEQYPFHVRSKAYV